MGTPLFAASIMEAIFHSEHELVAAVTATDKPSGRGRKMQHSAVKEKALELGISLLQPERLKDPDFIAHLRSFEAEVFVVVAFRMLPIEVWQMPPKGTFNLHASLLPQYRGAAPINWAIVNGEKESGLSTFFIDEQIDTGAVILQHKMAIGPDETAGSLHDRMMADGAKLVIETLGLIAREAVQPSVQEANGVLKDAPKIFKENLKLDPKQPTEACHNLIRGMSPFPAAWANISLPGFEGTVKILESKIHSAASRKAAGSLWSEGKSLYLACADGNLEILSLQLEGKKRLKALDFLNGQEINENSRIF